MLNRIQLASDFRGRHRRTLRCGPGRDVDDAVADGQEAVAVAEQRHYQLECQDCGAVLGYTGVVAGWTASERRGRR
jgi:hypothetical protein